MGGSFHSSQGGRRREVRLTQPSLAVSRPGGKSPRNRERPFREAIFASLNPPRAIFYRPRIRLSRNPRSISPTPSTPRNSPRITPENALHRPTRSSDNAPTRPTRRDPHPHAHDDDISRDAAEFDARKPQPLCPLHRRVNTHIHESVRLFLTTGIEDHRFRRGRQARHLARFSRREILLTFTPACATHFTRFDPCLSLRFPTELLLIIKHIFMIFVLIFDEILRSFIRIRLLKSLIATYNAILRLFAVFAMFHVEHCRSRGRNDRDAAA